MQIIQRVINGWHSLCYYEYIDRKEKADTSPGIATIVYDIITECRCCSEEIAEVIDPNNEMEYALLSTGQSIELTCCKCNEKIRKHSKQHGKAIKNCWFCGDGFAILRPITDEYGNHLTAIYSHDNCFDVKKFLASLTEEDWNNLCE